MSYLNKEITVVATDSDGYMTRPAGSIGVGDLKTLYLVAKTDNDGYTNLGLHGSLADKSDTSFFKIVGDSNSVETFSVDGNNVIHQYDVSPYRWVKIHLDSIPYQIKIFLKGID